MMLKTRPLCTGAELNLGDRVLDEVEIAIALLLCWAKGARVGSCPPKTVCPTWGEGWFVRSFIVQGGVADKDQGACRAHIPSIQRSSGIR